MLGNIYFVVVRISLRESMFCNKIFYLVSVRGTILSAIDFTSCTSGWGGYEIKNFRKRKSNVSDVELKIIPLASDYGWLLYFHRVSNFMGGQIENSFANNVFRLRERAVASSNPNFAK